jgi:hypothetical protein
VLYENTNELSKGNTLTIDNQDTEWVNKSPQFDATTEKDYEKELQHIVSNRLEEESEGNDFNNLNKIENEIQNS